MALTNDDILLPAFYFKVEFTGIAGLTEQYFQEVSGLSWELEVEDLPAGGANDYKIRLPKGLRYPNLMLKRSMYADSKLAKWMEDAIQSYFTNAGAPQPTEAQTDVLITLMNHKGDILIQWQVQQAFPLKWNLAPFNAQESKFVTETFEFGYHSFKRL